MKTLLENINSKTITSSGGIILSGFLIYVLFKVLTNDLSHISSSIDKMSEVQAETNEILILHTAVLESNIRILEKIDNNLK